MQAHYSSSRLNLHKLAFDDQEFIFKLLNTSGWIKNIGNRNIANLEDAANYITKINTNPDYQYWVIRLKSNAEAVGLVTFIKRNYLEDADIGFALLPEFEAMGYAFEAAITILTAVLNETQVSCVLATTLPSNSASIKLIERLGLKFEKSIHEDQETLSVYKITNAALQIQLLITKFYNWFTSSDTLPLNKDELLSCCLPELSVFKVNATSSTHLNLDEFVTPRFQVLSDGTLTRFSEHEIAHTTKQIGAIAQRYSYYQKSGMHNGVAFKQYGHKLFNCIETAQGWKIATIVWQDEL